MDATEEKVLFMARHLPRDDLQSAVKFALIDLSMPTGLMGYRCLVHAVVLYYADPSQPLTKQLYPDVGRGFMPRLNGRQVEKLIRYAIEEAWKKGDREVWHRYFPGDSRPTNGEMISKISEILELWQACSGLIEV